MARNQVEVFVVDDDEAVRTSLCWLIESADHRARAFATAKELLDAFAPKGPCCVVTDVRMPGMSGLDLLSELAARQVLAPIVVITAHGDIQMAVEAMKKGAFDFVEKPFDEKALLEVIERALAESAQRHQQQMRDSELSQRLDRLTPREHQVLDLIIDGNPNRAVADILEISEKTVEAHRAHIMEKMAAGSFADLVARVVRVRLGGFR